MTDETVRDARPGEHDGDERSPEAPLDVAAIIGDANVREIERSIELFASAYKGPLPPPEAFHAYETVLPGCAERIVRLMETEAEHRRALEQGDQAKLYASVSRGQWFAFILALLSVLVGAGLIWADKDATGFLVLLLGMGSAIGPFLKRLFDSARSDKRDLEDEA